MKELSVEDKAKRYDEASKWMEGIYPTLTHEQQMEAVKLAREEMFECPNIKIKDAIEVSSRMKHIDEDLKPIADFIMDYASWNLHKDEWNRPTIEVPLFRVLDALVQRGKPYCQDTTPAKE